METVRLNIGKLSAVVPDSLSFCFNLAIKDTKLEGARLVINEIPAKAKCGDCNHEWAIDEYIFTCPECAGGKIEIVAGKELDVESIEIKE